jgi:hypothetical protein
MTYAATRSTGLIISTNASAALGAGVVVGVDEGGGELHFGQSLLSGIRLEGFEYGFEFGFVGLCLAVVR